MSARPANEVSTDQLIQDFKVVVADAEALMKATADQGGEKLAAVRTRVADSLAHAKESLAEAQTALMQRTRAAARATDEYVHDKPWYAVGIAAAIGLLIGLLLGRR
jgi:ElaB/YqjD/DUF883 family membrane-anchored ribosome-binding protein